MTGVQTCALPICFEGYQLYFVIGFVHLKGLTNEAFHIRSHGFLFPLLDGEEVICWPLRALTPNEVTQEGTTQMLEVVDGRGWQLREPLPCRCFESGWK